MGSSNKDNAVEKTTWEKKKRKLTQSAIASAAKKPRTNLDTEVEAEILGIDSVVVDDTSLEARVATLDQKLDTIIEGMNWIRGAILQLRQQLQQQQQQQYSGGWVTPSNDFNASCI